VFGVDLNEDINMEIENSRSFSVKPFCSTMKSCEIVPYKFMWKIKILVGPKNFSLPAWF
jgi:hypothetical protein